MYKAVLLTFMILIIADHARARDVKLIFPHPVQVAVPNRQGLSKPDNYKPGAEVKIAEDTVYWITAKGKVPVLIIPMQVKQGQEVARLKMPDVAAWPSALVDRELDNKITAVMDDLLKFQVSIVRKDAAEAQKALERMERVRNLDYYHFLRASLYFIKGDLANAKDSVRKGLKRYPTNEQGQQMLKLLEETPQ